MQWLGHTSFLDTHMAHSLTSLKPLLKYHVKYVKQSKTCRVQKSLWDLPCPTFLNCSLFHLPTPNSSAPYLPLASTFSLMSSSLIPYLPHTPGFRLLFTVIFLVLNTVQHLENSQSVFVELNELNNIFWGLAKWRFNSKFSLDHSKIRHWQTCLFSGAYV